MVTVPKYQQTETLRPNYRQGIDVQAAPDDFGAAIGRGMQQAAQGVSNLAGSIQAARDLADETVTREALNDFIAKKDTALYGEGGFATLEGKQAIDGFDKYQRTIGELRLEASSKLTSAQQTLFNKAASSIEIDANRSALQHRAGALKRFVTSTAENSIVAFKNQAVTNAADPAQFQKYTAAGVHQIADLGEKLGWSSEEIRQKQSEHVSDVYRLTALQISQEDLIAAVEFLSKNKGKFTAVDLMNTTSQLAGSVGQAAGRDATATMKASGAATNPIEIRSFLYSRLNDGHGHDHIDNLNQGFAANLARMMQDAPASIRNGLGILSGFRSVERQQQLWEQALKKYGSAEAARKWVAPPGNSQHNHGNAVDLAYNGQSLAHAPQNVVDWVHQNAGKYGLYFPLSNENWHIETMGTRGTAAMSGKVSDLTGDLVADVLNAGNGGSVASGAASGTAGIATGNGKPLKFDAPAFSPRVAAAIDSLPGNIAAQVIEIARADASQFVSQQNAEIKAQQMKISDDYKLRIAEGDTTLTKAEIVSNPVLDSGDKAILLNTMGEKLKEIQATQEATQAFEAGRLAVDPYSSEGRKTVDSLWKGISQKIMQDGGDARPAVEEIVRQTGTLPSQVVGALRAGLSGQNAQQVANAAAYALRLSAIDPAVFERREGGKEISDAATIFSHLTQTVGLPADVAAKRLIDIHDPTKQADRKALLESEKTKTFLKDNGGETGALAAFAPGFFSFSSTPKLGETPAQSAAAAAEYDEILKESLADTNGDRKLAQNLARDRFRKRYGVSNYNLSQQKAITRLPPEVAYPVGVDGTWDYIAAQAKDALSKEGVSAKKVFLQADERTEADVRAGKPARYVLFYKDEDGFVQQFQHPFYAEPPTRAEVLEAKKAEAMKKRDEAMEEIELGRDRERNLDQYLAGPIALPY